MSNPLPRPASLAAVSLAALLGASPAFAQSYGNYVDHQVDLATPLNVNGANVIDNAWVNLSSMTANGVPGLTNTGGFPGTAPWTGKASQVDRALGDGSSVGGATLGKVSNGSGGGPYAAGSSIYYGGISAAVNNNGGTLAVTDSTPITGLQTVVFQAGIGEAWTYDFFNHALPTLSYTTASGTTSNVAATFSQKVEQFFNGTVAMPTGDEAVYINQYALQWDLSGVTQPITSFNVSFTGVQHAQLYGVTLTQSDVFKQVVAVSPVPEPGTYAMMSLGLMAVWLRARRRNRA